MRNCHFCGLEWEFGSAAEIQQDGIRSPGLRIDLADDLCLFDFGRRQSAGLGTFFSVLIIMPVVTFYLICDWHTMIEALDGLIPLRHRETLRALAREIDVAISGFLRGQLGVCVVLGLYYGLALTLIGLNFGFLIGSLSGLVTFVPYVGSLSGLLVATSVAVAQFWPDWKWIVAVIGIFLVGQFVEGNIISPKLVGKRVGLHPVLDHLRDVHVRLLVWLCGSFGGGAACSLHRRAVTLRRAADLASPMYKGDDPLR